MLMKHLHWPARLVVKLILLTTSLIIMAYLLTCNCSKKQYVGQIVDEFRFRWNSYKGDCRKHQRRETCMQQHTTRM